MTKEVWVSPYERYAGLTKLEKIELDAAFHFELQDISEIERAISKLEFLDQITKNKLIKELDNRAKKVWWERKILSGKF